MTQTLQVILNQGELNLAVPSRRYYQFICCGGLGGGGEAGDSRGTYLRFYVSICA